MKYLWVSVPGWLCSSQEEKVKLTGKEVVELAVNSYSIAVSFDATSAGLWYDLAVSYNGLSEHSSTAQDRHSARETAVSALNKSISIDEESWSAWNLMGVLRMSSGTKLLLDK